MIKVDQTTFGLGKGNCFPACVSTLTGIPLHRIPNFCELYAEDWYLRFVRWCRPLGLAPWSITLEGELPDFIQQAFPDIPWIACGNTDRGLHCCVYVGNSLYHDPNPCRDGLKDVIDGTYFLSTQIRPTALP